MRYFLFPAIVCILVITGSCKKTVEPKPVSLTLNKNTVSLQGNAGSSDTIQITSNDKWTVSIDQNADWITVSPSSGEGNGMFIITSATGNQTSNRRTANIEVRSISDNNRSSTVTVTQLQYNEALYNAVFGGEGHDSFTDMIPTSDGGYIAVGTSASMQGDGTGSKGGEDVWVVKFNNEGEKVWHKKFGGSLGDGGNTIIRTPSNSYLILATTLSNDGDVTNNKGGRDAWLISIDGNGNLLWQKTFGGSADERLFNLKSAGDGSYLMSGWTESDDGDISANAGNADAWLVSVNASGDLVWEETYGGTGKDLAYDATPVSDGGYVFCGQVSSTDGDAADRTSATPAAWFVKINSAHGIGGKVYLGQSEFDFATVAMEAGNGDFVFAGETGTPGAFDNFHADKDIFVCRIDATGGIQWKKAYGGSMTDAPGDLVELNNSDLVLSGYTASSDGDVVQNLGGDDGWMVRLNGAGDILNTAVIGGAAADNITRLRPLTDTHIAFAGSSGSYPDAYPDLVEGTHGWFQVIRLP